MTPPTKDAGPGPASRDPEDEAPSPSPDPARGEAGEAAPGEEPGPDGKRGICELCGGTTVERHCKIVCLNCGYKRDCSDP